MEYDFGLLRTPVSGHAAAPPTNTMNSRRLTAAPRISRTDIVAVQTALGH